MTLYYDFAALDDRFHCAFAGSDRFVISSKVDENWKVRVGLVPDPHRTTAKGGEDEARWWQMCWNEEDAKAVLDPKLRLVTTEDLANLIDSSIKTGKISLDGWDRYNPLHQVYLKIPNGSNPIRIPLHEMTGQEVASFAAKILFEIARDGRGNIGPSTIAGAGLPDVSKEESHTPSSSKPLSSKLSGTKESEKEESDSETQSEEGDQSQEETLINSKRPKDRWHRDHPENGRFKSPKNKLKRKLGQASTERRDSSEEKADDDLDEPPQPVFKMPTTGIRANIPRSTRWQQQRKEMEYKD